MTARRAQLAKALSVIGGADLSGRVLVFATAAIAARALTPGEFGKYVLCLATAVVAAGIWDIGLTQLIIREIASGRVGLRSAIRRASLLRLKSAWLWALALLVAFIATGMLTDRLSLAIVAISLTVTSHQLLLAGLRAKLEFRKYSAAVACGRAFTFLLAFAALFSSHGRLLVLVLGYLLGELVTLALTAIWLRAHWLASAPEPEARSREAITIRRSAPMAANAFLVLAYTRLDVVIVGTVVPSAQLGFYAIASRAQDALSFIPRTLSTALLPMMSSPHSRPRVVRALIREGLIIGLAVCAVALLAVEVATPQILTAVTGGGDYLQAVTPVRILAVSVLFMVVASPFLTAFIATNRAESTVIVYGAAFGVAMLLLPILAARWGATGAAIATLSRNPGAVLLSLGLAVRYGLLPKAEAPGEPDGRRLRLTAEDTELPRARPEVRNAEEAA